MLGFMRLIARLAVLVVSGVASATTPYPFAPAEAGANFGYAVALHEDLFVVGSRLHDGPAGANQGSVTIYRAFGSSWYQDGSLTASDAAPEDRFGSYVATWGDMVLVGVPQDDIGANANQGSAYLYQRTAKSWDLVTKLVAPDGGAGNLFGSAVAISGDTAVVGARGAGPNSKGAVYVFRRVGGIWSLEARIALSASAIAALGWSVAIDGDTIVAGAPFETVNGVTQRGAAYIFQRTPTGWSQQAQLIADDGAEGDLFGASVGIRNGAAVVGAPLHTIGAQVWQGAAYVFEQSGPTWSQHTKLVASDGQIDDSFGNSVAISNNTIVVGAYFDSFFSPYSGSAYVFERSGDAWIERTQLVASTVAEGDAFGLSVAISQDRIAVGAPSADAGPSQLDSGSAWLFTRVSGTWIGQNTRLLASDGLANDSFGQAVAISGDTAVVGAPSDDIGSNANQGSAYVYVRRGSSWIQQAKLTASDGAASDTFGVSVAISGDTIVVGAYADTIGSTALQGSAYVYTRSGTAWSQQAKLTASNGRDFDLFGSSVAVSGDTVLVGAPRHSFAGVTECGSAYVFTRAGTTWTQQVQMVHPARAQGDRFGESVAISGEIAVVGASTDTVSTRTFQGSAHVFVRSGTSWSQSAVLVASDGSPWDLFGISVSISGESVLVGARGDAQGLSTDSGSAYVFQRVDGIWTQEQKLDNPTPSTGDQFGVSVAIHGDIAVIGASGKDLTSGQNEGVAWVFVRQGTGWIAAKMLLHPTFAGGDSYGRAVAITDGAGIVGAFSDDVSSNPNQGSAWTFESVYELFPVVRNLTSGVLAPSLLSARFESAFNYQEGDVLLASRGAWLDELQALPQETTLHLHSTTNLVLEDYGVIEPPVASANSLAAAPGYPLEVRGTLLLASASEILLRGDPVLFAPDSRFEFDGAALLRVQGHWDCRLNEPNNFVMAGGTLRMEAGGATRRFEAMAPDRGTGVGPFSQLSPDLFLIGTLHLDSGSQIVLTDAFDNDVQGQGAVEAVYVDTLRIDAGARLMNQDCRIYYRTLVNNGIVDVPANAIRYGVCFGDFNLDALVDDTDFVIFAEAYQILLCDDPSMPSGCPADLNLDTFVDDADFVIFATSYSALICS